MIFSPNVRDALQAINDGATADSQESPIWKVREDPRCSRRRTGGEGVSVDKLVDEAVCMANGEAAMGYIVVGVADKVPGREAFTGTINWMKKRSLTGSSSRPIPT